MFTNSYGTPKYMICDNPQKTIGFIGEGLITSYNINQAENYIKKKFKEIAKIEPVGTKSKYEKKFIKKKIGDKLIYIQNNPEAFLIYIDINEVYNIKNEVYRINKLNQIIFDLYGWVFIRFAITDGNTNFNNLNFSTKINLLNNYIGKFYDEETHYIVLIYEAKFSEEINCINFETLYHLTKKSNLNRIKKYGLCPKTSDKFLNIDIDKSYDRVYFGRNLNEIKKMFEIGDPDYNDNKLLFVLLRINPEYMNDLNHSIKFYDDVRTPTGVFTLDNIAPYYLQYFDNKEWKNLIKYNL